ncbi:hypothetical protein [Methylorubrum extorquens]|uniref:Uncharacterized protein n=1 Tax=Methylorubrum extorquens (strain ATCC 14718 / DSM 1338 / JCM 2805 / NCIMB 9133 / AM1) TaxID=272630 RepID=C5B3X1_METEA|nr:hypothetical protein [Methylorubrum extorquens]ACS43153.1 Hypothetical protein MexAM1_META2p0259 [Methylorubrum extorquens AM1]MCP1545786.1 hypothetical protein [Methylorubrum extorquens]MCP1591737.1 hypothetical protein [Methylorubrum extorquens]
MRPVDPWLRLLLFVAAPSAGWNSTDTGYAATIAVSVASAAALFVVVDDLAEIELLPALLFLDALVPITLLVALWVWIRRRRIVNVPGAVS